jgi:hypothetical protein
MTPEAEKRNKEMRNGLGPPSLGGVEQRADSWEDFDLWGRCITKGLIGSMLPGNLYNKGNQILQAPGYVVIRNEMVHETRVIPVDGRPHVGSGIQTYMGDGRGHWEGDTLVVDVTGQNDKTWFDRAGNFHSDALHVVERYTPRSPDILMYEATIEDPKVFSKAWKISMPLYRHVEKNAQLLEFKCVEFAEELLYGPLRKQPRAVTSK